MSVREEGFFKLGDSSRSYGNFLAKIFNFSEDFVFEIKNVVSKSFLFYFEFFL